MQNYQYVMPKVGVSTNGMQLKINQQKLLQENYQKSQQIKDSLTDRMSMNRIGFKNQISDSNPFLSQHSDNNLRISRAASLSRLNKNVHEQMIRASLLNQLSNQITIKQQLKKYKKQEQIETQRQIVRHNKLLQQKQISKQRNFRENVKNQANQITKLREIKKQQEKYSQHLQKTQINRQYQNNQDMIRKIMDGVQQSAIPKRYSEYQSNRVSQSSLSNYNNPQIRIIPTKSHHRPSFEESSSLKAEMRQTLLQQIRQNSQKKISQRLQKSNTKFVDDKYKMMDNPITNPIDFKMAKDNPYVIKELLGRKMAMQKTNGSSLITMGSNERKRDSKGMNDGVISTPSSYLSRRGSNSLSRLVY